MDAPQQHSLDPPETPRGLVWGAASDDLNWNLLAWPPGATIEPSINAEVDVLLVVLDGDGAATVDGRDFPLNAGATLLIPRGAERAVRAGDHGLRYVTVHRRRHGLQLR